MSGSDPFAGIGEEPRSEVGYSFLELVPPERLHKAEPPFHKKTHIHSLAGPACGSLSLPLTP